MNCPVCKKIEMNTIEIGFVEIDECPNCHGLYFDNFELKRLDETHEGEGPDLERILSYESEDVRRDERIECPKCECMMREHKFSAACEVRVDECASCGAMWLDKGELLQIRKGFATDEERKQLVDAMATSCGFDTAVLKQSQMKLKIEEQMRRGKGIRGRGGLLFWAIGSCSDRL